MTIKYLEFNTLSGVVVTGDRHTILLCQVVVLSRLPAIAVSKFIKCPTQCLQMSICTKIQKIVWRVIGDCDRRG